ncbi:MAG TPA: hypothetical protein VNZ03_35520 [Terriglobales bacterium]|nr:hypothetical protein [Terriglobales bacterium]
MYLFTAVLVIAGWLAVLISSRRTLQRRCAELRLEFLRQDSLSASVTALEQAVDARTATAPISAVADSGKIESSAGIAAPPIAAHAHVPEEITPETLATIAETITALLGKKICISSVKILPTPNAIVNPWAQQGRVVVQASHYLASRRREP